MDIRQLRYFICIAECGSLSKAAEQLRIAQPSLGQHVLNLEAELGVQLLNRSSRGVTPTRAGERLVEHARTLLQQIEQVKADVRETAHGLTGRVILGMPEKYSTVLTVPIVERVERQFPNISLRIIENMSGNLLDWVLSGRIDLAILIQVQRNADLVIQPVVAENLYLVGSADCALRALDSVPFRQLVDLPLILPSKEHGLRMLAEEMAAAQSVRLTVKSEIDSIPAIKSLLRVSRGYTLLSEIACTRERRNGDLWAAPVVDPPVTQIGVLAHSSRRDLPEPAEHIRTLTVDVMRERVLSGAWPGAALRE